MRVARLSLFIRFYLQPHLQAEVNYVSASGVQLHTLMVMSSRHYGHLCLLTRIWHSSSDLVLCASLAYRDLFSKAAPYQQEGHAQYSQEASPWRLVPGCDLVNSPGSPACSSFKAPAQVSISQPASQPASQDFAAQPSQSCISRGTTKACANIQESCILPGRRRW